MNQTNPNVILYGQALVLLQQISANYAAGDIKSVEDVTAQLRNTLTQFEVSAGQPLLRFDPFAEGEPPISSKMNDAWHSMQDDINILENQMDVLRASAVFTHNLITTEILKSAAENARVNNKLKTLQLYSDSIDSSIVTFGDNFHNDQFIDIELSKDSSIVDGVMSLGTQGAITDLSNTATLTLLPESNGFSGNNQEINDPNLAPVNPVTGMKMYTFVAETTPADDIASITDTQPDTWYEYEHVLVKDFDKFTAGNLNFTYFVPTDSGFEEVDWSNGPDGGVLKLGLQFDLGTLSGINHITYTPYGLTDNSNGPVLVEKIQISSNGTDWTVLSPTNVWIGTDPNLAAARTADNVVIGTAVWNMPSTTTQFVRLNISQPQPKSINAGHIYYITKDTQLRTDGPAASLPISTYYNPDNFVNGDSLQQREYFIGQRWAIGIRDIVIQKTNYTSEGTVITKPLLIGGLVDRVSLEATVEVPSTYSNDRNWVSFFISPDDGTTWHQISRIQDDFLGIPEIIAYNDPLPVAFHEPGVFYYNVANPVTSLRLKIQVDRPDDQPESTPIVRSYTLKVKMR